VLGEDYLLGQIRGVGKEHFGVYGSRRVWIQLHGEGIQAARCTVERLVHTLGLEGARRGGAQPTTIRRGGQATAGDLLARHFGAAAPNQKWVADLTDVEVVGGYGYTPLITD
jgi:putative transposase